MNQRTKSRARIVRVDFSPPLAPWKREFIDALADACATAAKGHDGDRRALRVMLEHALNLLRPEDPFSGSNEADEEFAQLLSSMTRQLVEMPAPSLFISDGDYYQRILVLGQRIFSTGRRATMVGHVDKNFAAFYADEIEWVWTHFSPLENEEA